MRGFLLLKERNTNSPNSVYSHFYTIRNHETTISKQHSKQGKTGEVERNYKMFQVDIYIQQRYEVFSSFNKC